MADIGFQCKLSVNDGAANIAVDFTGHTLVVLPSHEVGEKEVTEHSQADNVRRFIPTLVDSGKMKVEFNYKNTLLTRLRALLAKRKIGPSTPKVAQTWVITAPEVEAAGTTAAGEDPQKFTFEGWVSKIDEMPFERDGELVLKAEIRVNGPMTVTVGGE